MFLAKTLVDPLYPIDLHYPHLNGTLENQCNMTSTGFIPIVFLIICLHSIMFKERHNIFFSFCQYFSWFFLQQLFENFDKFCNRP